MARTPEQQKAVDDFVKEGLTVFAAVATDYAINPNVAFYQERLINPEAKMIDEELVRQRLGDKAAKRWLKLRQAHSEFMKSVKTSPHYPQ